MTDDATPDPPTAAGSGAALPRAGDAPATGTPHSGAVASDAPTDGTLRWFRQMADQAPVMMWVTDIEGRCTFLNASWYAYTGQTEAEGLGLGWLQAVHPEDAPAAERAFLDANAREEGFRLEYRLRGRDGTYRWFLDAAAPMRDEEGRFRGYVGSVVDIHERLLIERERERALTLEREMRAELEAQALEMELQQAELETAMERAQEASAMAAARERELRELTDNLPQLAWMAEPDGSIGWYNERMIEYTGFSPEALRGMGWTVVHHPDHVERVTARFVAALATGEAWEDTFPLRAADGTYRWFLSRARPIRDGEGRIVRWFGTNTDVTAQREMEEDREFLFALGAALQQAGDADGVADVATRRLGEYLGLPRCGWSLTDLSAGTVTVVREHRRADLPSHVGTIQRSPQSAAMDAPLKRGEILSIPDAATHPLTAAAHERWRDVLGIRAIVIVPLVRDGEWVASLNAVDTEPRAWTARELTLLRAAAERVWPAYESHRAQALAEAERQRLQAVLDALPVGVVIADGDGRVTVATPETRRLWSFAGGTPSHIGEYDRLEGRFRETGAPLGLDDWPIVRALRRGETCVEELVLGPEGAATVSVLVSAAPVRTPDGRVTGAVAVLTDATGREQLEDRLRQAQKMEAVGQLAGGVAHDFNNLLTVISANLEFVQGDLPGELAADHPVWGDLAEIAHAAERARGLVRQLLTFSRKQPVRLQRLRVGEVVHGAEKLLRRVIGEEIVLSVELEDRGVVVRADPGQLEQVLMNLAVNARDAMLTPVHGHPGTGGTLSIEVGTVELSAAEASEWGGLGAGHYVRLRVRDTGHGMDAQTQAHAFEPFFTTKDVGAGTGLGLATVFGIVRQVSGALRVDSMPGQGTTVTILLPAAPGEDAGDPPASAEAGLHAGSASILLVEDEAPVRIASRRMLERRGYTVLEARHGADALLLWRKHAEVIDAVVTDLRMPEMGGRELIGLLRADRPSLPVVYVSGYWDRGEAAGRAEWEAFVEKPFTAEGLLEALARVLQHAPRSPAVR